MKKIVLITLMIVILATIIPIGVSAWCDGDIWDYGMHIKLIFWFTQYSDFYCPNYYHYANAMINYNYTGRIYAQPGYNAYAETGWYLEAEVWNSYYGHDY